MTNLTRSAILAVLMVCLECASALAGRPLTIDDAAPVATGQLEFELGFSQGRPIGGGRDQKSPILGLTHGV